MAVTGVSGSGKSTLAFDVLFAEGQRRFLDCLSTYVRQFIRPLARPDVDRVEGVPPTVALEQKLSRGTPLSTVGTASEVYHYLRLLLSRLGVVHCRSAGWPARSRLAALAGRMAQAFPRGARAARAARAAAQGLPQVRVRGRREAVASPRSGRRRPPSCGGAAEARPLQIHDVEAVVARVGRARPLAWLESQVARALGLGSGTLVVLGGSVERFYSTRRACPGCGSRPAGSRPAPLLLQPEVRCLPECDGFGAPRIDEDGELRRAEGIACPACSGTRLRPEARAVRSGAATSARSRRSRSASSGAGSRR